jgi:hypoxanthine phosphoribosyltransferase
MGKYIKEVLISKEQIHSKVMELGAKISKDYEGKDLLLICVLRGAFIFMADLVREIKIPVEIDFMLVSSYGNNTSTSGVVKILTDLDTDITGRNVIIVEDMVDTGLTLKHLKELLLTRNPESIAICTIFDKPERRRADIKADYVGMEIPDEFIVGYGLDYAGNYRHLPDVFILGDDGGKS